MSPVESTERIPTEKPGNPRPASYLDTRSSLGAPQVLARVPHVGATESAMEPEVSAGRKMPHVLLAAPMAIKVLAGAGVTLVVIALVLSLMNRKDDSEKGKDNSPAAWQPELPAPDAPEAPHWAGEAAKPSDSPDGANGSIYANGQASSDPLDRSSPGQSAPGQPAWANAWSTESRGAPYTSGAARADVANPWANRTRDTFGNDLPPGSGWGDQAPRASIPYPVPVPPGGGQAATGSAWANRPAPPMRQMPGAPAAWPQQASPEGAAAQQPWNPAGRTDVSAEAAVPRLPNSYAPAYPGNGEYRVGWRTNPSGTERPSPTGAYPADPNAAYRPAPSSVYPSDAASGSAAGPRTVYPAAPTGVYPAAPASVYPAAPTGVYPAAPASVYPAAPTGPHPTAPSGTYRGIPSTGYPADPNAAYPSTPAAARAYQADPNAAYPSTSGPGYSADPNGANRPAYQGGYPANGYNTAPPNPSAPAAGGYGPASPYEEPGVARFEGGIQKPPARNSYYDSTRSSVY